MLAQIESAEPVSPGHLVAGTPRDFETICLKCLEKDPTRRYADGTDLAGLNRSRSNEPILARRATTTERNVKWVRRNRVLAALLATVVIGLLGTSAGLVVAIKARNEATKQETIAKGREDEARISDQKARDAAAEATKQAKIAAEEKTGALTQTEKANTRLHDVHMDRIQ